MFDIMRTNMPYPDKRIDHQLMGNSFFVKEENMAESVPF